MAILICQIKKRCEYEVQKSLLQRWTKRLLLFLLINFPSFPLSFLSSSELFIPPFLSFNWTHLLSVPLSVLHSLSFSINLSFLLSHHPLLLLFSSPFSPPLASSSSLLSSTHFLFPFFFSFSLSCSHFSHTPFVLFLSLCLTFL